MVKKKTREISLLPDKAKRVYLPIFILTLSSYISRAPDQLCQNSQTSNLFSPVILSTLFHLPLFFKRDKGVEMQTSCSSSDRDHNLGMNVNTSSLVVSLEQPSCLYPKSSEKSWWRNPEKKKLRRVAKYNMYSVEGRTKVSVKKGLCWIKEKCQYARMW